MTYARQIRVEFNHCDPAGIVFYPRYFEMMNSVCENFFREAVGVPFEAMMAAGQGVPTARAETDFRAPSRLGDLLDWSLVVERLGGSSVAFRVTAACEGEHRLTAQLTLVWITAARPTRWTDAMRAALAAHEEVP
jgi:4-hydroxybenzoyl-CoA thioesterase